MKNSEKVILVVGAAFILFGLFVVAIWLLTSNPESVWKSAEWASWVQAIGSIAAIGVAIWLSREDIRRAERERQDARATLAKGVSTIAMRAKSFMEKIDSGAMLHEIALISHSGDLRNTYIAFAKREAQEIHSILAEIPIEKLAEGDLMDTVLYLRLAMSDLIQQIPYFEFDMEDTGRPIDTSMAQFQKIHHSLNLALQKLP